jgi:hypothetical protein
MRLQNRMFHYQIAGNPMVHNMEETVCRRTSYSLYQLLCSFSTVVQIEIDDEALSILN